MDYPVGVLTLRVWRDGNEAVRARTETKFDIEDRSPPVARHHATMESVLQEVADWLTAYEARASSAHPNRQNKTAGPTKL